MSKNTILKGAFVAFCLIGMLVLPAAAAPSVQGTTAHAIDQGLKDDLWANHQQYRLQRYDTNIERAASIISILNKYGIDTTACTSTLSTISSKRPALETALANRDRAGLKTVEADLRTLWKQFMTEMRDAFKNHYGKGAAASDAVLSSTGMETLNG
jgi:hypothetical protein